MDPTQPAVTCTSCARAWNSATMAEGLHLLGACPRCGGALTFRDASGHAGGTPPSEPSAGATPALAPHLVLGLPRR